MSETDSRAQTAAPRLQLSGIRRQYPAVLANDDVSLSLMPGAIHGLIGENGAGKSTLMKIAYGLEQPDAGTITWEGRPVRIANPGEARALGIGMVFQHFSLLESLSVLENAALMLPGARPTAALRDRMLALAERYGLALDPGRHVADLTVGERQRVEIVRALMLEPRLLILDEPTAVLTPQAVRTLFDTLRRLAGEGVSILLISHKLEEVRSLCEYATVMRAGRVVAQCQPARESVASLSRMMLGETPQRVQRPAAAHADRARERLLLEDVHMVARDRHEQPLDVPELLVRAGEIVGIAGISGNGQHVLLDAISGERRFGAGDQGEIRFDGQSIQTLGVRARRRMGLAVVPEERLGRAAVPALGLDRNVLLTHQNRQTITHGLLQPGALGAIAAAVVERFGVRTPGVHARASSLSGGNLQKFVIGREIAREPELLVLAQPTWGVDVGSAARIHQALMAMRERGAAIIVISEDLERLFLLSDAMYVIAAGRLSARLPAAEVDTETLGRLMAGAGAASVAA
ncbi:MAG: ABC transporter ATP-binding protein [Burkholderiaceae bacterium]